eukprot:CAMPEP_0185829420 /NCGR_PEP_ID=MMETSP1353-20130828/239_1 /TAXON_ID=1077150 /ORGANISM="Erythrolobus australicus, Strain CCMP3124" /LENGTH=201 /DNA_ID=CAMNT_0028527209 /DNA_START=154 /DNA_END=759 /DNA_ORIENTATION=-
MERIKIYNLVNHEDQRSECTQCDRQDQLAEGWRTSWPVVPSEPIGTAGVAFVGECGQSVEGLPHAEHRTKDVAIEVRSTGSAAPLSEEEPQSSPRRRNRKRLWSAEEDQLLRDLVEKHGAKHWGMLSQYFTSRSEMQLRARWAHTLSNLNSKRPFSPAEDAYILAAHAQHGNAWSKIASGMNDRLGNRVKNRYNALMKARV